MEKQSLTIEYNIDKEIKKGDKVKFIDEQILQAINAINKATK